MKVKPEYWDLLLALKKVYAKVDPEQDVISVNRLFEITITNTPDLSANTLFAVRFLPEVKSHTGFYDVVFSDIVSKKLRKIIQLYLPIIFVNKKSELPYTVVHIAQSIDGKIATVTGKSKWIGNTENLIHAHRLRALTDAVLVGGTTFRLDKPQLNVRLVKGDNPVKVIITGSEPDMSSFSDQASLIFTANKWALTASSTSAEVIHLPAQKELICTHTLLGELKKRNIHSVLIEGGSQTIRKFLEDKSISRIEFHIAPLFFGSGKNGIELDPIDELNEALVLKKPEHYKMGNAFMVVSEL